jgi:hypothetical protein
MYSIPGGRWSLTQTLDGLSAGSEFGSTLAYNPTGTQFAVGVYVTNSGMYEMYDACM